MAYTDYVLEKIFSYARENLNLQAMIYFSDHGENMKYRHIADPLKFDMLRIPLWVYLSPQYKKFILIPHISSGPTAAGFSRMILFLN